MRRCKPLDIRTGSIGSGSLFPAAAVILLPIASLDSVAVGQALPRRACLGDPLLVEEVERTLDRDHFMTAQEAVEYGIIDNVIEHR